MSTKGNNISQITDYLKGNLDARAMYAFERDAQDDPFLMDALDGFEAIGNDQSANLDELKNRLADRVAEKKDRGILLWRILPIAACLLLVIGGYWLFEHPAKQQHIDNLASVKQPTQAIENAKKPSTTTNIKKPVDSSDHLVKNNTANIPSSPKTENKRAEFDEKYASMSNLAITRNEKGFYGGDVAPAIKNIPKDMVEKVQVKDDYAYQSSSIHRNRVFGNLGNAHLKQSKDTSAGRFLNTDLLSANSSKSPRNTATAFNETTPDKSLSAPVIRGYVKINKPQNDTYIITGKEVQDNPVGNVEQLLQGKVAGLNIQNNAGAPGMRGTVNIRGLSSISGSKPVNIAVPTGYHLISGKIIDSVGQPMIGAVISLFGIGIGQADSYGEFHVAVPPKGEFYAMLVGYKARMVEISKSSYYSVRMEEYQQRLNEVTIRGYVNPNKPIDQKNQVIAKKVIVKQRAPGDTVCRENIAFRDKFLSSICVKIKYEFEKSNGLVITVSDKQYRKALKFLAQYVDLKQPAYVWHEWYNNNKCNNLK